MWESRTPPDKHPRTGPTTRCGPLLHFPPKPKPTQHHQPKGHDQGNSSTHAPPRPRQTGNSSTPATTQPLAPEILPERPRPPNPAQDQDNSSTHAPPRARQRGKCSTPDTTKTDHRAEMLPERPRTQTFGTHSRPRTDLGVNRPPHNTKIRPRHGRSDRRHGRSDRGPVTRPDHGQDPTGRGPGDRPDHGHRGQPPAPTTTTSPPKHPQPRPKIKTTLQDTPHPGHVKGASVQDLPRPRPR
jgi:hypothetical protein